MADVQIKEPNLNIVGQSGLCLAYVTDVFGVTGKYAFATLAWNDAAYKHSGAQPPADVCVPVWFSWTGTIDGVTQDWGHVAVWVPGRGIYSTSAHGDKVFSSLEALLSYMGEGMKYLGYTEDINGTRVAEVDLTPAPTPAAAAAAAPQTYKIIKAIPGYGTANNAANHTNPANTVAVGNYDVFNTDAGMINVSTNPNIPGSWINPGDNVVAAPAPPAAPAYSSTSIQAPVYSGMTKSKYTLKNTVMAFVNANDAVNHKNAKGTVAPGSYFVYNTRYEMLNLSKVSTSPGSWINPADDTDTPPPPPTPAPVTAPPPTVSINAPAKVTPATASNPTQWKSTYKTLRNDRKGVKFTMLFDYTAYDFNDFDPTDQQHLGPGYPIPKGTSVVFYGTFTGPDDNKYYRPQLRSDNHFTKYIGVPVSAKINGIPEILFEEQQLLLTEKDLEYHTPGTAAVTEYGKAVAIAEKIDNGFKSIGKVIDGILPRRK